MNNRGTILNKNFQKFPGAIDVIQSMHQKKKRWYPDGIWPVGQWLNG